MSTEISIEEIKEKFQKLQDEAQRLKEEKVKYEAQLSTLKEQYNTQLQELLESTKTSSLPEAVEYLKKQQNELESLKSDLQTQLDGYLSTIEGTESNDLGSLVI